MNHGYQAYQDLRILSADPVELVRMLYRGAIDEVRKARQFLATGAIRERSKAITKATEILLELTNSLNHEKGGDLSRRLGELYAYAVDRLTEANVEQKEAPLEEVQRLLMTLIEGWNEVEYQPSGDVAAATAAPEAEPAYAGSSPAGWGGAGRGEGPVTRQSWSV